MRGLFEREIWKTEEGRYIYMHVVYRHPNMIYVQCQHATPRPSRPLTMRKLPLPFIEHTHQRSNHKGRSLLSSARSFFVGDISIPSMETEASGPNNRSGEGGKCLCDVGECVPHRT